MLTYKYNPQNASFEELRATFTARDLLLSKTLKEIKEHSTSKSNQHYLVIGQRGIGKTNFLHMIYLSIKEDSALSGNWIPLQFAEEEYSIGSLRDLFEKTLEVLKIELPVQEAMAIADFLEQLQDEDRDIAATEKAIAFLKEIADKNQKKLVLLVDNLDLILGDQLKEKIQIKRLRDILMNENFLVLIGAAPTYFDEVSNYEKPLYNFFKIVNLDDFDIDEMQELICRRATFDGNTELAENIARYRPKLKAVYHLTGGNPRLILMLYQLLTLGELTEVKDYLQGLLDDLTPYYQYKLKWLSPQQRRIIDGMARLNRAVSPTEIAAHSRLAVNVVSTNLKRLMDWGYIRLAQQERRKATYYIISERLFRIWHQMRHSPGMRKKIQFFVEFIQVWYAREEMKAESEKLIAGFTQFMSGKELLKARSSIEHLDYLAEASSEMKFKQQLSEQVINMMIEVGDLDDAERKLREKIRQCQEERNNKELAHAYSGLGIVYHQKNRPEESLAHYDKALEIQHNDYLTWNTRGATLAILGRNDEALASFEKALTIQPDYYQAWYNCGIALENLGRHEEALRSFDKALEIQPECHEAWNNRGVVLVALGQYEDAIVSYDKALEIQPSYYQAWANRGDVLEHIGRHEDALRSYDKALSHDPNNYQIVHNQGKTLSALFRFQEALKSFESAVSIRPKEWQSWCARGFALTALGRHREALESFDRALTIQPGTWESLVGRGFALVAIGQYEEAFDSYDKAQANKSPEWPLWLGRGVALEILGRHQEALENLNRGIEITKIDFHQQIFYFFLIQANLGLSSKKIFENNYGEAKAAFISALESLANIEERELVKPIVQLVVHYFLQIVSEQRVGVVKELFALMEEPGLAEIMESFRLALSYWEKGKDAEVLDRLNPEVREIVEQIIRNAENSPKADR